MTSRKRKSSFDRTSEKKSRSTEDGEIDEPDSPPAADRDRSRDRDRDRDRSRERHRRRDRDRSRDRSRDDDRYRPPTATSTEIPDRFRPEDRVRETSREKSREKDRDRDREREKEREREREREKEREREREREREKERERERERQRERDRLERQRIDRLDIERRERERKERDERRRDIGTGRTNGRDPSRDDKRDTRDQKSHVPPLPTSSSVSVAAMSDDTDDVAYRAKVEAQLAALKGQDVDIKLTEEGEEMEEKSEEQLREERRRKREQLLKSFANKNTTTSTTTTTTTTSTPSSTLSTTAPYTPTAASTSTSTSTSSSTSTTTISAPTATSASASASSSSASTTSTLSTPSIPRPTSTSPTPALTQPTQPTVVKREGGIAALAALVEHQRDAAEKHADQVEAEASKENNHQPTTTTTTTTTTKKEEDGYDMFSDSPSALVIPGLKKNENTGTDGQHLLDNWDDHEGYYRYRLGDILNDRYRVCGLQGSGVFSTVLRVKDQHHSDRELVVKLIRNNETMYKAGMKELELLKELADHDPDNKKHCVRLLSHFMHRSHLCLVFEPMAMDLRKVIKKFGSVGLAISAVRSYAKQMMIALRHLKKCNILHGDIKPDNILVNESMHTLKICDLGSAGRLNECEITPYLVSRFYRAPEVILGLPYNEGVDTWSIGCVLYELYTGKILFPGRTNNDMLRLVLETKGRYPTKLLKRATFTGQHYDHDYVFQQIIVDPLSGQELRKPMTSIGITRDLLVMLRSHSASSSEHERRKVVQLSDLISQCLTLDSGKRPPCEKLLIHPFIMED